MRQTRKRRRRKEKRREEEEDGKRTKLENHKKKDWKKNAWMSLRNERDRMMNEGGGEG